MDNISPDTHLAIIARLVSKAPGKKLGRTQLMKLCYFLQEIEQVPVRYDFRLFNFGPFDSDVLSDLGSACGRDVLNEETVKIDRGYRYEITPTKRAAQMSKELRERDRELATKIDRIVEAFAGDGAGELELKSTILFVDREFSRSQTCNSSIEKIAERVHSVKPHFLLTMIQNRIQMMKDGGYLNSLQG